MPALPVDQWLRRFRRRARPDRRGGVSVKPRSIYILPTKQGMLLAVVILLMLTGSINYGSNLGHLMTFLLGGIWLTAILHTWRNLLGLGLQPRQVASVFAGQTADFTLLMVNVSALDRFGITLKCKKISGDSVDIPANDQRLLHLLIPTHARGELPLPDISLHTSYPLGLFHAWTYARLDLRCLVYPKPAGSGEPPSAPVYTRSDTGDRGFGADDFVGLRNFRPGDSPRHIDWKAHARERGLLSKQFGGDRTEEVRLDWDLLPKSDQEKRLSLLCRFILQAEEREQSYGLRIPGQKIESGMGSVHRQRCLTTLARFGADNETIR
ncbi:MAG: DUF58 domain-containing protein [Candidatus Thiodiazotropha sp. (ex Epidulcina cf. delphinae)]|nr:DUF58 domain-containing protein [Candidatus Thiodiazotropha sp. (ex Epidulcina cf. delphinae)]